MTPNQYGDNPFAPGMVADTYIPDQLIAGDLKLVTQPILLGGGAAQPRGTVLGRITTQPVVVTAGAGNTGNGAVGSLTATQAAKIGAYQLKATDATHFSVTDPEGAVLPAATVGTAYSNNGLNFTISAGGTAFAANDTFTIGVEDAIGQYIKSVKTASDGSQNPCAILVDYTDASAGVVRTGAYVMGEFNGRALNYDVSWTLETLLAAMAPGVFIKSSVSAADPT